LAFSTADFAPNVHRIRELIVEFLGPFTLCFIGIGAIVAGGDVVAVAFAHGLAIGVMVAAAGHISGGVYNPAVVVGLVVANRMSIPKGVSYVIAQLAGAVVGALAVKAAFPDADTDAVQLGVPQVLDNLEWGSAFIAELIMTFLLMFVIFGVAIDNRGSRAIAGLAIGLTITMDILAGGVLTGAAMNPARAFGPAVVQNVWDDQWIFWVACPLGAVIAAALYQYVLLGEGTTLSEQLAEEPSQRDAIESSPAPEPAGETTLEPMPSPSPEPETPPTPPVGEP
jgi:aquaporin TIP